MLYLALSIPNHVKLLLLLLFSYSMLTQQNSTKQVLRGTTVKKRKEQANSAFMFPLNLSEVSTTLDNILHKYNCTLNFGSNSGPLYLIFCIFYFLFPFSHFSNYDIRVSLLLPVGC